ncbi:MAG: hypothetical protein H7A21_20380 [Spirochaetales bacterium]|nr:hypothetical protein [Leptospiraceae bacterium]MCP5483808.1 hypothetical protein [Spirochaetales bacterium]
MKPIVVRLLLVGLLAALACSEMGPNEAALFVSGDVVTRSEAKAILRAGIGVNIQSCPGNAAAGLYASEQVVAQVLNRAFYERQSIETCFLLLAATSCNLNPNTNQTIFLSLYESTLRLCNPRPKGL